MAGDRDEGAPLEAIGTLTDCYGTVDKLVLVERYLDGLAAREEGCGGDEGLSRSAFLAAHILHTCVADVERAADALKGAGAYTL